MNLPGPLSLGPRTLDAWPPSAFARGATDDALADAGILPRAATSSSADAESTGADCMNRGMSRGNPTGVANGSCLLDGTGW